MTSRTVTDSDAPREPYRYRALRGTEARRSLAAVLRKMHRDNPKMAALFLRRWRKAQAEVWGSLLSDPKLTDAGIQFRAPIKGLRDAYGSEGQ